MSEKVIFEVKNVGVSYRQRVGVLRYENYWALKDVSFALHAGETLGVIGSNGAGKSTLLRMIAGIIDPDCGQIWRQPNTNASLLALNVGFRPELSGRENAILSGLLLGMPLKQIKSQIDAIHQFSGLGNFFERAVGTYSTGMRARLGFAVAIQANPDILLIDEVLGVGDQNFKDKSHAAMKEKIESKKTVVLVSHSMEAIKSLCDRVLWLHEGRSIICDNAEQVTSGYLEVARMAYKEECAKKAAEAAAAL
ncbi:ABC transporter ATP-binding protein [Aquipseudomonas ullengensis]|uniref:ABC transporter ATP-binding protein n=1 Tax=Aquipseudomonas ullengensis TaxID=2759166 RepID=A0A7W4LJQ9_9GAMM|nr:ABC transporter ATP-binding protein [Pseudomonas ullengensis]MBB2494405.1 ABC transporter ATP-binding protein [Pseudomonas ullengensis]